MLVRFDETGYLDIHVHGFTSLSSTELFLRKEYPDDAPYQKSNGCI
jgi:hypothetical protein